MADWTVLDDDQDPVVTGEWKVIEDASTVPMGKPRPAPPRPKPKLKKRPRQPLKPIPVTDEMKDAMLAQMDQEYARRLLKEQKDQEAMQTQLNTLSVFQPMAPGMGEFRTASQEDLNIQAGEVQRGMKDVLKSGKKRAIRRAAQGKRITPIENYLIQQPDEMDLPQMPDTTLRPSSRFASDVAAYFQPVAQMVPTTIEGLVELMDMMGPGPNNPTDLSIASDTVKAATGEMSSFLRGAMPTDPQYPETDVLGAFGSATGFIAGGLGGRALGIPAKLTTALLGAGLSMGDAMREADFNNIDPKRRDAALILAGVSGLTEMAGVGRMINSLGLKRQFYKRMFEVAEEGGQEALQTWLGNINAAYVGNWDPTRPLNQDVMKNALLGAIVGGGIQGISWARQKMKTPKPFSPMPGNKFLAQGGPARIPPPQGYQPPMPPNRIGMMYDHLLMGKKKKDPKLPPTPEEIDEIFKLLPAPPDITLTPKGRRRLPNWSDTYVDSLSEEVYQAQIERHDAIKQVQEAKASFPKDAYGNTKVSPSTFHSLIIRVESIANNSPTPIEDIQKLAPNDPELTDSLLNYLLAYERMESARRGFDEAMIGKPGRRVFGEYDHPAVAEMSTEEYELRYEAATLLEKVDNAAYAFYPMLKPFLGEYLGNHTDHLKKAIYNPEARALVEKAIAEHPFLDQIWEGYVDAMKRLGEGDHVRRVREVVNREAAKKSTLRPTTGVTEEEYQRREQKELDEVNKGIVLDKLGKINDRQNIIMEKMLEYFKQKEGDKYSQLDSDNVIQDIISNSKNPLEDMKNLFPGDAKFARLSEMYLKNVEEQDELFSQLPPQIPDMDAVRRYNQNEKFVEEYRAGLNYDPRNVREAEQEIRKFERQFGKEYSISKAAQHQQADAKSINLIKEMGSLDKRKHHILKELKETGELKSLVPHWETFLDTLIDDSMSPKDWNMLADAMDRNPKLNDLVNEYVAVVAKRKEIQTGGLAQKPTGLQLNQEQRKKEEEHKKLSKLAQDLDDQLWEKTPQNIKDMPEWEHTFIPGRAYYDYHLANNFNLLQQRMEVYEQLVDVFAKPQDKELNKKLKGWEKEINEGGLKPFKPEEEEAQIDSALEADTKKFSPVRTTPGGRLVYGVWEFSDDQVDNMSQEEYNSRQELTELYGLRVETVQKLWPFFKKDGQTKASMLRHLQFAEKSNDVMDYLRQFTDVSQEFENLIETYAYIMTRLQMISDEMTERVSKAMGTMFETEDAFFGDERPLTDEEIDEIVGVGTESPEGWGEQTEEEIEEEKFLAPGPKKPGDIDYGIMYKPTGIEEWQETKKKAIEEGKKKEDPDAWADDIDPDLPMMGRVPSNTSDIAADTRKEELPPYTVGDPVTGYHGGYTPEGDDFAFDVMPSLSSEYGQAPYLRAPRWVFDAIAVEIPYTKGVGGLNISIQAIGNLRRAILQHAPSKEHQTVALRAINDVLDQAIEAGTTSIALLNLSSPQRGLIEHELSHVAQLAGLKPHPEWAMNHPFIQKLLRRRKTRTSESTPEAGKLGAEPLGQTVREAFFGHMPSEVVPDYAAMEVVAYWVQDNSHALGMTEREGRQFFKDYMNHLRSRYGQQGVDRFKAIGRYRPEVLAAIEESNQEWGQWNQRRKEQGAPAIIPSMFEEMEQSGEIWSAEELQGGRPKKTIWQKMLDAFTKKTLEDLEKNPPAPTIPPDEPIGTRPPPPPPPRDLRVEGPLGPLRKEHVTPEYTQLITRTFTKMLEQGGIPVDPLAGAPFHQVAAALRAGQLQDVDIEGILQEEGVPWEQFAGEMEETASDAGKVLQAYSEIAKFWNEILDEYEGLDIEGFEVKPGKDKKGKKGKTITGPEVDQGKALLRIVPIQYRVKRILRHVDSTALGKHLWQRMGNTAQKAMLTQFSTFIVNSTTTGTQLPFRMLVGGMGAWMYRRGEKQGSLYEATQDALEAMRASLEVAVAMHPRQLVQLAMGQKSQTKYEEYKNIIHELEKHFDIHRKLFALGSGTETLKKGARELSIAQALSKRIPLNNPLREDILDQIDTYEKRLKSNMEGIGKYLNMPEIVYDQLLRPMQWAEYFLRRPMFVGQLNLELSREGLNLGQLAAANQLDTIPSEVMERAVNKALEFTYAYMPGTKTGTNYALERFVENSAAWMIKGMNKYGGPLNALFGEPFAKALFNGAKFVYEWSPAGGILPYARIAGNQIRKEAIHDFNVARQQSSNPAAMKFEMRGTRQDPVTGAVKLKNKTTQQDYDRLAKAMTGTMMYAIAGLLMHAFGGEEWWQFDLGERDEKGNVVYTDIRRLKPISTMFQLYDLVERMATGRMGDKKFHTELLEVMTGIRMYDNQMGGNIIESTLDWYRNEPEPTYSTGLMRGEEEAGKAMAVYLTPMLNVRDLFAQFMEEENRKKDTRGETILGPAMDRIPFVRRLLPDLTSPVEPSPIKLSFNPLWAQMTGYKEVPAENFAGREWGRLGLMNKSFLQRDPDPIINRAQNVAFEKSVSELGNTLANEPLYRDADDKGKAMLWEMFISGDKGLAAAAREVGAMANPEEAMKRAIRRGSKMGKHTRKATGFDEQVDQLFEEKK